MPHINENQNDKEKVYVTELQRQYLDIAREMNNTLVNDEDIERFGDFSRWIFAIDQLSEDFYKPGEDGKYPVMDEISINAFKNTYKRALNECDKVLLSNSDDGVSAKMKEIAARVKKNLLQDSVAFESVEYNENNPLTLDDVIGLGKTITADFGDQKVVAKGAAYSSRIPVKVKGLQGGDLDGFFTPSSYVNPTEQKEKLFEKLVSKYPELKDYLDVLKNTPNGKIANTHILGTKLDDAIKSGAQTSYVPSDPDFMKLGLKRFYSNTLKNLIPKDILKKAAENESFIKATSELVDGLYPIRRDENAYINASWGVNTKEGSNIDKRNCAMSAVSELLGKKGLVAEAKPMIAIIDGVPTPGTFMNNSNGYATTDGTYSNPMIHADTDSYNNPTILSDVAALQAIDYICGNIDRHAGNYMFRYEEVDDGYKAVGITGIDNDMSFGTMVPKTRNDGTFGSRFILPSEMGVLGENTANLISGLTRETLTMTLRGYGLSKEEINAAWERTKVLQDAIKEGREFFKDIPKNVPLTHPGHLRIVPESEWHKYTLDLISNETDSKKFNQFEIMKHLSDMAHNGVRKAQNKETEKTNEQLLRNKLFGEPIPEDVKIDALEGTPVGTGIKYSIDKEEMLGVKDPEHIKLALNDDAAAMKNAREDGAVPLEFDAQGVGKVRGYFSTGFDNAGESFANPGMPIDKSGVAMSKLGALLGADGAIAKTTTMQVQLGDRITNGVFTYMPEGKGLDILRPGDIAENSLPSALDGGAALKDLADIEIMDYICMNGTRGENDLVFRFSEDGKQVAGVSAGKSSPSFDTGRRGPSEGFKDLPALDGIKVVSETMAEKIKGLSTNALIATLEGQGLSRGQIFGAVDRFAEIKSRVESGAIKTVKDAEWKDMKLSDLAADEKSIFAKVNNAFTKTLPGKFKNAEAEPAKEPEFAQGQKVDEFDPEAVYNFEHSEKMLEKEEAMHINTLFEAGASKLSRGLTDKELLEKVSAFANGIRKDINSVSSIFRGESTFFKDLSGKTRDFNALTKRLNEKVNKGGELDPDDISNVVESLSGLSSAASNYSEHVKAAAKPSGLQNRRKPVAEGIGRSAGELQSIVNLSTELRKLEADPMAALNEKIECSKRLLEDPNISKENLEKQAASLIYCNTLLKNAESITKDGKMARALLQSAFNSGAEKIAKDPAFAAMMEKTPKEAILGLAKDGTGKKLMNELVKTHADLNTPKKAPKAKEEVKAKKEVKAKTI